MSSVALGDRKIRSLRFLYFSLKVPFKFLFERTT